MSSRKDSKADFNKPKNQSKKPKKRLKSKDIKKRIIIFLYLQLS